MTGTYNLSSGKGYVWDIRRNTEYYDNKDASFSNFDGTDNCYIRPVYGPMK